MASSGYGWVRVTVKTFLLQRGEGEERGKCSASQQPGDEVISQSDGADTGGPVPSSRWQKTEEAMRGMGEISHNADCFAG